MTSSLLPARSAAMIAAAISRAAARIAASCVARSSALSESARCAPIGSVAAWLTMHRQGCGLASLVMTARRLCKRAGSRRHAGRGLGQHAAGDLGHVGGGNVAHAAMVIHGAD